MKNFKKLSLRLLVLSFLIVGIFFIHKDSVSAGPNCEWNFQGCMDSCSQGNGPCYADCFNDYMRCILPSPLDPLID